MISMNKFLFYLLQVLHVFIAVVLLSSLFYIRLLPRVSRDLWEHLTYSQTIYIIFNISLVILNMFLLIKYSRGQKSYFLEIPIFHKTKKIFNAVVDYFLKTLKFLYDVFIYILEFLWRQFFNYHACSSKILLKASKIILSLPKDTVFTVLVSINCIPKFIFVLVFCYDVIYAHHLHYTFKCIPLLLVPLLEQLFIFIFQNFYNHHWSAVRSMVVEIKVSECSLSGYTYIPQLLKNPPSFVKNFQDFFYNHFMVYVNLNQLIQEYDFWKYKIFGYTQICIILCSFRLFALFFLLIYGIT